MLKLFHERSSAVLWLHAPAAASVSLSGHSLLSRLRFRRHARRGTRLGGLSTAPVQGGFGRRHLPVSLRATAQDPGGGSTGGPKVPLSPRVPGRRMLRRVRERWLLLSIALRCAAPFPARPGPTLRLTPIPILILTSDLIPIPISMSHGCFPAAAPRAPATAQTGLGRPGSHSSHPVHFPAAWALRWPNPCANSVTSAIARSASHGRTRHLHHHRHPRWIQPCP